MIQVADLRFTYPGDDSPTLHGLNFSVDEGEVFGFLGPSGAGKSTTQNVLTGLLDGYEGSVRLFDREVAEWGAALYERIGVSAETPNHYGKLTGRENLELFASLYRGSKRNVDDLLARVGLAEAADQRVGDYSKGMGMRLNFVRALLHEPDVLFLDEPTSGIDPSNARSVKSVVQQLSEDGTTIFLTTHDMTVADQLCDRIAFIVDGRLPVVDAPRALKLDHGEPTVTVEYRSDNGSDSRTFPLVDLGTSEEFQEVLTRGRLETIHTSEATLEDVFIDVTGEELT